MKMGFKQHNSMDWFKVNLPSGKHSQFANLKMAIENIEIVDLPMKSGGLVDLSVVFCERLPGRVNPWDTPSVIQLRLKLRKGRCDRCRPHLPGPSTTIEVDSDKPWIFSRNPWYLWRFGNNHNWLVVLTIPLVSPYHGPWVGFQPSPDACVWHWVYHMLVGGWKTTLKHMSSSMGRIIPYIMETKKCLKPPTR